MVEQNLSDEQTQNEIEQLTQAALEDLNKGYDWTEMNEGYFNELREKYQKGPDEIGPREFKSYINKDFPIYMIVIPQVNSEMVTRVFNTSI